MSVNEPLRPLQSLRSFEPTQVASRIDAVLEQTLHDQRLVGAVVLVAHRGELIYRRAAGLADREAQVPMREDALFRLSSVSKPIASVAALVLVAQGKIQLDDDISRWLPYFKPTLSDGQPATITLRQLLSHTAGLSYGFLESAEGGPYHAAGVSDGLERSELSLEENLRRLGQIPLQYKPGSNWGYSIATDVLGGLIAAVHGTTLAVTIDQLVVQPLQLHDTSFKVSDVSRLTAAYLNDQPRPHRIEALEVVPVFEGTAGIKLDPARALDPNAYDSGGSGLIGSAGEFLTLLETLRKGGAPLLPQALVDEMTSNQTADLELENWPGRGFGLGFTVLKDPAAAQTAESAGSWRLGGAYGHSWFVDPAEQLTVVAFTNTAFEGMFGQFTVDLCNAVYGQ
ncbi:CubicO group peptidase, beta-lactamase class C family [Pseudomonas chlororaphis]|uniref:serine hydrolase domain-containing protein n=1 Tax=Pseudomonas chlororaphis TaxID=587753 RepID=UPI00087A294A|nr:serine hydrolase domain-containing protein [Pseudomonas chlororaphis]AZD69670.1 Beta-lactamase [Pseudomonas chlororaphis subsp. aurantiaca]QIT25491.1 beta-lactamase family protein [Pseudomonas chlororaphis subsp. aurantiaca]WDH03604.1 serine hydrolase [Pseudomonas chlororaphis]WDH07548.1 serine hydrolase [Pseudomonas chlororaphis]SDS13351.1 CubicO group peptidase, beta-lactamase class C family [Pseudomonas chlororaphis]